jgi:hypothetical protein
MLRRALGISTVEPCFGFITVAGLILPAANFVAFFMLKYVDIGMIQTAINLNDAAGDSTFSIIGSKCKIFDPFQ